MSNSQAAQAAPEVVVVTTTTEETTSSSIFPQFFGNTIKMVNALSRGGLELAEGFERTTVALVGEHDGILTLALRGQAQRLRDELPPA